MNYEIFGHTCLRVFTALPLGTMTFGTEWGWGADKHASKSLISRPKPVANSSTLPADIPKPVEVQIPGELMPRLYEASTVKLGFPHSFFHSAYAQDLMFAGKHRKIKGR
ncbi:MAG: hypothetical protein NWR72_19250 [Bacteroidia bacterium]|nr:hypothetical protein [Bacteroidia bacterium]